MRAQIGLMLWLMVAAVEAHLMMMMLIIIIIAPIQPQRLMATWCCPTLAGSAAAMVVHANGIKLGF